MTLARRQKKYIKRNLRKKSLSEIALQLNIQKSEIEKFLEKKMGSEKFGKLIGRQEKTDFRNDLQERVKKFEFKKWVSQNPRILSLLSLLVLITYINTLGNEFISDDIFGISKNPNIGNFKSAFSNPFAFVRPLINFTIYNIFGLAPWAFRITNIISHLFMVLAIYLLLDLMVSGRVAVFSSVIFAVHPILTESVTWISGGGYTNYSLFLIISLIFYILSSSNKKYYWFSVASFTLALLFSEKAVIFPGILVVYELMFATKKGWWKKLILFFLLSVPIIWTLTINIQPRISNLESQYYQKSQIYNPLIQIPIAITSYLDLIFWPDKLTLYHSELAFSKTEFIIRASSLLLILGIIILEFFKGLKGNKIAKQIFFWLSFFIISLTPTLNPFGVSWIVAERYVYLGSLGIFVLFAMMLSKISGRKDLKNLTYIFFSLIIIALFIRTVNRNIDWKTQDNLWLETARTSPSSPQNHNNLGDYYARQGDFKKAEEEFKTAIELKPGNADAHHNLANTYQQTGDTKLAIENYKKAIEYNPNLWQSYQNLAAIYLEQKEYDSAKAYMLKAIEINPNNLTLKAHLGLIYYQQGEVGEARKIWEEILIIDPENRVAKSLLIEFFGN